MNNKLLRTIILCVLIIISTSQSACTKNTLEEGTDNLGKIVESDLQQTASSDKPLVIERSIEIMSENTHTTIGIYSDQECDSATISNIECLGNKGSITLTVNHDHISLPAGQAQDTELNINKNGAQAGEYSCTISATCGSEKLAAENFFVNII